MNRIFSVVLPALLLGCAAFFCPPSGAADAPLSPVGAWDVRYANDGGQTGRATMVLAPSGAAAFSGHIDWIGQALSGREFVSGVFGGDSNAVTFAGTAVTNASGIATNRYRALLSPDGRKLESGSWPGSGTWSAARINLPFDSTNRPPAAGVWDLTAGDAEGTIWIGTLVIAPADGTNLAGCIVWLGGAAGCARETVAVTYEAKVGTLNLQGTGLEFDAARAPRHYTALLSSDGQRLEHGATDNEGGFPHGWSAKRVALPSPPQPAGQSTVPPGQVDWSREVRASLIWTGVSFGISLVSLAIVVFFLSRATVWGRQVRRITRAYFTPRRSVWPLIVIALVLLLTLFSVRLSVLFSFWRKEFYDSIQVLDEAKFWAALILFCVLAFFWVARGLLDYYVQQAFLIHWRIWLNDHMLHRWLQGQAYYRTQFVKEPADNPDQRIQQDVESFVSSSLGLTMGLVNSVVSLYEFTIILWSLSATLHLFGIAIPRAMVGLVFGYVVFFTLISFWIGRPFVRLRFMSEKLNADYRYALVRMREYGESIAFYQGEGVEGTHLRHRFAAVIGNAWALVYRTLKFYGFNLVIDQASVIFPFVVQAKRLFAKQITFGDVMQTVQAFSSVYDSLSFFRNSYDQFASYRAVLNRLTGFLDAADSSDALPRPEISSEGRLVATAGLTVSTPGQQTLLQDLNLQVTPSTPLLVQGRSGAGKTTLLRTLAGLWPHATGRVTRPSRKSALFLSQKPYLPLGTLKGALYYPDPAGEDEPAIKVLRLCQLDHLIPRLLEDADWSRILSVGEQQRLAFGRVLLHRPEAVLLDEATSAMDEALETTMYSLLCTALPETTILSVGHRSTLRKFHRQGLTCEGDGRWRMQDLGTASGPE